MITLILAVGSLVAIGSISELWLIWGERKYHQDLSFALGMVLLLTPPLVATAVEFFVKLRREFYASVLGALVLFVAYLGGGAAIIVGALYAVHSLFPAFERSDSVSRLVLIGIWLAGAAFIGMVAWRRTRPDREQKAAQKDARNWHLDRETGESYRVVHRRGDVAFLHETKSFQQRLTEREELIMRRKWLEITFFLYLILGAVGFYAARETGPHHWLGWVGGIVFVVSFMALMMVLPPLAGAFSTPMPKLGPRPVEPPNRKQEVEREKVFGAGGFATPEAAIAAAKRGARSGDTHPLDSQEFDD